VPFLAGSEEPSLTQNTDRNVLANLPIFLREHLIFKVLRRRRSFIVARHQAPTLIGC
jgi:hypothetical protein